MFQKNPDAPMKPAIIRLPVGDNIIG